MEPVYIVIAVVGLVAVALAFFFLSRKKPTEPNLQPRSPAAKLPDAESRAALRGRAPTQSETDQAVGRKTVVETVKATPSAKRERDAAPAEESKPQTREEDVAERPPLALEVPAKAAAVVPEEESFGAGVPADPAVVRRGLTRTRGGMIARLAALFRRSKEIDPALLQDIEEVLLSSDVGVKTTQTLIARLQEQLQKNELKNEEKVWDALRSEAERILSGKLASGAERTAAGTGRLRLRAKPTVVMMVGVNGSGKTTTIGKLASKLRAQGKSVVLGAGDTFRAAAVQQLEVWGTREGATVIKGKEQSDPASVLFEAVQHAKETGADVVLCDTAGRLHTKSNLMDELAKVRRTIAKALDGAPHETLLVLDATNGQNALQQARQFQEAIELTGVVLTKLDGTAKGGVILAIADELKLPVRYIGIGERAADLREFDAAEFVEALFASRESLSNEAA